MFPVHYGGIMENNDAYGLPIEKLIPECEGRGVSDQGSEHQTCFANKLGVFKGMPKEVPKAMTFNNWL